jgi:hypothetical protein
MHDVEDSIWTEIGNQQLNLGSIWKHEQVNDSNGLLGNDVSLRLNQFSLQPFPQQWKMTLSFQSNVSHDILWR